MSGAAMTWAADRNRSGDMGISERLVLIAMAEPAENASELKIVQPDKFWQDNYLVIVLD